MRVPVSLQKRPFSLVFLLGLLGLAACASNGSLSGKVTDGVTGQPRSGVKLTAKATEGTSVHCQSLEATTGADGAFTFGETCAGHKFKLESGDKTLALEGELAFNGGEVIAAPLELKAWRTPEGKGLFLVADDAIDEVKTSAEIVKETIGSSTEFVVYPDRVPSSPKTISGAGYLVLAGKDTDGIQFHPLIKQPGKTVFNKPDGVTATLEDVYFAGAIVKNQPIAVPEDVERAAATLDASKTHSITAGKHNAKFIFADALPAGLYAAFAPENRRMYILQFGDSAPTEAAPTEAATAEAPAEGAK